MFIAGTCVWKHTGGNTHIDCRYEHPCHLVCNPWQPDAMAGHCADYQSMAAFRLIQMYASEARACPSATGNLGSHEAALFQTG